MSRFLIVLLGALLGTACSQGSNIDINQRIFLDLKPNTARMVTNTYLPLGSAGVIKIRNKVFLLTNYHVCVFHLGNRMTYQMFKDSYSTGEVIKTDPTVDLCLVDLPEEFSKIKTGLTLGKTLDQFQRVYLLGYPLDYPDFIPSEGRVVSRQQVPLILGPDSFQIMSLIITNIKAFPGNSGSPVVNESGELIGVLNSGDYRTNYGNIIPVDLVKKFLKGI